MSTLAVWRFRTSHGAERGGHALQDLPRSERLVIHDAARVSWPSGRQRPTTHLMPELARDEGLGEAFWGVLFGVIFFSPLLGAAVGSPLPPARPAHSPTSASTTPSSTASATASPPGPRAARDRLRRGGRPRAGRPSHRTVRDRAGDQAPGGFAARGLRGVSASPRATAVAPAHPLRVVRPGVDARTVGGGCDVAVLRPSPRRTP